MSEAFSGNPSGMLRRSCRYCRGRKIRCSGSLICSACQERGIDCVYDVEAGKGRPRNRKRKDSDRKEEQQNTTQPPIDDRPTYSRERSGSAASIHLSSTLPAVDQYKTRTIGDNVEQMFDENFKSLIRNPSNVFQKLIGEFHQKIIDDPQQAVESTGCSMDELDQRTSISYDSLFASMRAEMIEMIATRFGSLGCELREPEGRRFYLASMVRDQTPSMFDRPYEGPDPLLEFPHHRIFQLIDTWFGVHPLSAIVSKTLLINSLKANTVDRSLLAMILADAISAHGASRVSTAAAKSEANLLLYAETQIQQRSGDELNNATCQALALIGWRKLCIGEVKRATCYLGYAGRAVTELNRRSKMPEYRNHQRINGFEIGTVETEIMRNIYWTVFSTSFWAIMQLGAALSHILPKALPIEFPPITESSSVAIRLDLASDNISTLLPQSRSLRGLWPLSQIACTTVHICALDPADSDTNEAQQATTWQSKHLHSLRRLLKFHSEVSSVCVKVTRILQEAILDVESEIQDEFSQTVVLCAYWTLIVQLLLPKNSGEDGQPVITTAILQDFCKSLERICVVVSSISTTIMASGVLAIDLSQSKTIAETLICCLDACSRALDKIHSRTFSGHRSEYAAILEHKDILTTYATQLHEASKSDVARSIPFNRPIKRRLKAVKKSFTALGQTSTPVDHGILTDADYRAIFSSATSETPSLSGDSHVDLAMTEHFKPRQATTSISSSAASTVDTGSNDFRIRSPKNSMEMWPQRQGSMSEAPPMVYSASGSEDNLSWSSFMPNINDSMLWAPKFDDSFSAKSFSPLMMQNNLNPNANNNNNNNSNNYFGTHGSSLDHGIIIGHDSSNDMQFW